MNCRHAVNTKMPMLRAGPALTACTQDLPVPFCLQREMAAFENFGYVSGCREQSGSRKGQVFGKLLGGCTELLGGSTAQSWAEF